MLELSVKSALSLVVLSLVALEANAGTGCDQSLTAQLQDAQRLVRSIRVDKPGQARVFAADGSEYTASAARWMRSELDTASLACARGDNATAVLHLESVRSLRQAHRPPS